MLTFFVTSFTYLWPAKYFNGCGIYLFYFLLLVYKCGREREPENILMYLVLGGKKKTPTKQTPYCLIIHFFTYYYYFSLCWLFKMYSEEGKKAGNLQ